MSKRYSGKSQKDKLYEKSKVIFKTKESLKEREKINNV